MGMTSAAHADTIIGTIPGLSGQPCCFAGPNNGSPFAAGESFTVPSDNVLQSFGFYVEGTSFQAYVTDGSGEVLYQSLVIGATQQLTQYIFATGGLTLVAGDTDLLFLAPADNSGSSYFKIGLIQGTLNNPDGNPYPGGEFWFTPGGYSSISDLSWFSPVDCNCAAAFTADFTSPPVGVPTPIAGVGLPGMAFVLGVIGLIGWRRRRPITA